MADKSNKNMNFGQLSSLNLIQISGEDASSFLQGQLTNDVDALDQNWQLTGYCNPKGRLLALMKLWRDSNGDFYALLENELCEPIIKRLRMYVMRSKVVIQKLDDRLILGFATIEDLNSAKPLLEQALDPQKHNQLICSRGEIALIINKRAIVINQDSQSISDFNEQWEQLNINEGLPSIWLSTSEMFVPQMINLDLMDAINFKKGCYTGQEIVARMHYLGKLKQRLFVCELETEPKNIKAGDKIFIKDSDSNATVGNIVSALNDHTTCLAVLKLESSDQKLVLENQILLSKRKEQPYLLS